MLAAFLVVFILTFNCSGSILEDELLSIQLILDQTPVITLLLSVNPLP